MITNIAPADITVLEITRIFDAPRERVFDAWTVREEWQSWIGPEGIDCEVPTLDARVGGRYKVIMRLTDGRIIPVGGVFREVDRPQRLVFTWKWEGEGEPAGEGDAVDTLITLTFRDVAGKTELTLRHEGLRTVENRDSHGKGWNSALNKLVAYLARRERSTAA
jgi:uncharacterized protein YndB with AHSA1/START domain